MTVIIASVLEDKLPSYQDPDAEANAASKGMPWPHKAAVILLETLHSVGYQLEPTKPGARFVLLVATVALTCKT